MFKKNFKRIENLINKLDTKLAKIMDLNKESPREKFYFEVLDAKGKAETELLKSLKEKDKLKDSLVEREKQNEDLEKKIELQKKTIQDLTSEINTLVKYKNERESLIKEKESLQKKLEKLEAEGMVLPKRVRKTGVTKDTKQVIGIKESKVSSSTKKELKKINELREKEEV